jgi:hypothetical protein
MNSRFIRFIYTFSILFFIPVCSYADKFSDAVCDGDCHSSNTIDGVLALLVIAAGIFFGTPRTKLIIYIWLGIPLILVWITGNSGWVFAFVPTFFLAMYITDPIAKYFGWGEPDKPQELPLDTNEESKNETNYVIPVNNTHVKEGVNSEPIVSEKKQVLKGNIVLMTTEHFERIREEANQYRKEAEQGDAAAQCALGQMYSEGRVEEEDEEADELAVYWFRKAAEQGDETGQFLLGQMYSEGRGVEEEDEEADELAVYWFRKAAEQGYDYAEEMLEDMRSEGRLIEADKATTLKNEIWPIYNSKEYYQLRLEKIGFKFEGFFAIAPDGEKTLAITLIDFMELMKSSKLEEKISDKNISESAQSTSDTENPSPSINNPKQIRWPYGTPKL